MTKIRESLATFFSIFAGLFVVYIVLDWGMDLTGRHHSTRQAEAQQVGKINGDPILFKDFSDAVRKTIESQRAQNNGVEPDESQQRMVRDQVWNQFVDDKLYGDEIQRLGIAVTDNELRDYLFGDNPPEGLRRLFTDSTGQFHRDAYEQFLQNPNQFIRDPQGKDPDFGLHQLADYERSLRRQLEREKLQSIVMASVQVDEADVRQRFIDQNIKYEADYVFLDPNALVKDNEISVTDDDLRHYYNEHSDEYKMDASRRMKYVLFSEAPSKADTTDVIATLDDVAKRAKAGAEYTDLAKTYSEVPPNDTVYHRHGEFSADRGTAIFGANIGDILGPIKDFDGYHVIKVIGFRTGKEDFIRASHILIRIDNNDSAKALKEARDILAQAKRGDDFGALAAKFSADPGSGSRGGDLGWFGKGRMVKSFEEAAFKAKTGQIVGPVRSQFGYHIIKVTGRDNREVRISDIVIPVHVSAQTRNDISQRAQDFSYLAKQGSFDKEATDSKYNIQETQPFQKNAVIPGIGMNQAANKFAFNNKSGTVSEAFQLQNGFGVFMVTEVKDAGIRPFDEVKPAIENRLRHDKKMEKTKALALDLRQSLAPTDSLGKLSAKNPTLVVQHIAPLTLGGYLPGIGRDPGFVGGISSLGQGEISKPIESSRGIYIVKLISKTPFDTTAYNAQRASLRSQMLAEKRNRYLSEWSDQLKKSADIVDNRDMFYR